MNESLLSQLTLITWKPFIRGSKFWDNTISSPTIKLVSCVRACTRPHLLRACQGKGSVLEGVAVPFVFTGVC